MITKIKYFEALDSIGINSETEVKKREIQDKINQFNSNKNSLNGVMNRPVEQWEEQAKNIIKDNSYLATYWRLLKNKYDLELLKKSSIPADIEAANKRSDDLRQLQKNASDIEQELNKKILEDKKTLTS